MATKPALRYCFQSLNDAKSIMTEGEHPPRRECIVRTTGVNHACHRPFECTALQGNTAMNGSGRHTPAESHRAGRPKGKPVHSIVKSSAITLRTALVAVVVAGFCGSVSTALGDPTDVRLSQASSPVCAPPDGAPHWTPEAYAGTGASAAHDSAVDGLEASGRIGGVYLSDTRIDLTGLDACEQRIDRSLVTTPDGSFLFTGLMPGRYALLDGSRNVLTRLDLTAESPDRSDLDLTS